MASNIVDVVRVFHSNDIMGKDVMFESFHFENKKENFPFQALDFGLSLFFKLVNTIKNLGMV